MGNAGPKNLIKRIAPFFYILTVWVIFSTPFLFQGFVPFPSKYQMNFFAPWSSYGIYKGPVKNNAMPDVITQIYPWRRFAIESYKNGRIPFWNPNSFSGNPHLANYQSAALNPFNALFFFLPFLSAWSIIVLLTPLLAAVFMYLFTREFGLSLPARILGSVTFMFCGYVVVWMAYGTLSLAICYLPFSLFLVEKLFKKIEKKYLLLLCVSVPFSLFSGHFQTSLYFLLFIGAYFLFKLFQTRSYKKALIIFLSLGLGLFLSFPQLVPSIEFYLASSRSESFITGGGIPFQYLITSIAPDFFGNPVTRNDWFGYYAEWSSFVGIIPLLFALFALFWKLRKYSIFFMVMAFLVLILALNSPAQAAVNSLKIPVFSTSNPNRIIVLFSFSVAVLSAIGFDSLRSIIDKRKKKSAVSIVLFAIIAIFFVWSLLLLSKPLPIDKLSLAKRNLVLPTLLLAIFSIAIFFALMKKKFSFYLFIFLVILATFDSLRFAQKWMPFDESKYVFPDTRVVSAMKKNLKPWDRVFGNLGNEVGSYYNIPLIEGYDPLYIDRYGEFIQSASKGQFQPAQRSVVQLDRRGMFTNRVLDLLGVTFIFHPSADTNQNWAFPVWDDPKKYRLIYNDGTFQLFKNTSSLERATIFYSYLVLKDQKAIVKRFYDQKFDFRKTLILEDDPKLSQSGNTNSNNGSANIISYNPNSIVIQTKSESQALLFLSDPFYPQWGVSVNGKEATLYRADYAFRAVKIPKGNATVEFYYKGLL